LSWSPQVPMPLLCDPNLRDRERVVLIALIAHVRPADGRLTCWPSNARLAAMSACTPRNVQQVLKALESKGYVERKTNGSGRNMALTLPYDGWTTQPFTPTNSGAPPHEQPFTPPHEQPFTHKERRGKERREQQTPARGLGELMGMLKPHELKAVRASCSKMVGAPADRMRKAVEGKMRRMGYDV